MHQTLEIFHSTLQKESKLDQKLIFWLTLIGFLFTPSYAHKLHPNCYTKLKISWRYQMVLNFVSIAFAVRK